MEINSASSTPRTTKVRTAKPAVSKSGVTKAPAAIADKPKAAAAKPAAKSKAAAAPRKRIVTAAAAVMPAPDLTPMIATAAYYLAERRHFAPGYEMQDWLAAEHLIRDSTTGK